MTSTGSADHRALEAMVGFSYDHDQLARLAGDLRVAGLLDLDCPEHQTMLLRVTADSWQLDLEKPTLFGAAMTLVRHRNGGAEYLDHTTRTRLVLAPEDVPPAAVRRPGRWRVSSPNGEDELIEVVLEDSVINERWVQRIRTGRRCDDADLVSSLVEALLVGGSVRETSHYPVDEIARVLARRGLPIEVSLHAEGSEEAASRITVTYPDPGAAPAARPLDGYRDLRDPKARKAWSKPGPGLREVGARDLDELRAFEDEDDPNDEERQALMMRDGGPDREPPEQPDEGHGHHRPPSTITTEAAQVALRIEQRLLDDLQRAVNAIAAHLSGIDTAGTDVEIRWLEDMVSSARRLDPADANGVRTKTKPGTGLPALLHEDPGTGSVKRCVPGGGRGIVDRKAAALAADYMATGAIPARVRIALSAADITTITTAIASVPPAMRFGSLAAAVRTRLIAAVAFEKIGTLRFSLGDLRKPINFHDLYLLRPGNFAVSLRFPEAIASTDVPPAPMEAPLLSGLRCRTGGTINGTLSLAALRVDAELGRTPLPLYWALLVAGGPLIPIFFPQFAWVLPILWSISLFLATDSAGLQLQARPLTATVSVGFAPRPPSPALRPRVSARLHGSVRTRILSYVPDGIHQLADWAVAEFTNMFGATLSLLEGQLASGLQRSLDAVMGDGVPGSLLRLGVPVASGSAFGTDDEYVYLESSFGVPGDPSIRIAPTQVSAALRFDLARDIARVFGADGGAGRGRHYLSLAGSINAVNQVVAVLWRRGEFNAFVAGGPATALRPLLTAPFGGSVTRIDTSHRTPPVFSLPAGGPSGPHHYFDVVFPSFLAAINRGSPSAWLFRYRINARGIFGLGAVPDGGRFLSLDKLRPNVFEALIEPNSVTATLLEASHVTQTTITVEEAGNDPRHPQVIRPHEELVEDTTDWTAGAPAGWTDYGRGLFVLTNLGRDAGLVPRLDAVKGDGGPSAWPPDGVTQQTYAVDGSDPDDATARTPGVTVAAYAQLPVDWGFNQGLSFAHAEASGAFQQLLSGAPHLNSFTMLDAELVYPFLDRLKV
jgi:hypothetical protein